MTFLSLVTKLLHHLVK